MAKGKTQSKVRTFNVWAQITALISVPVTAAGLEDALVKARELKFEDFVDTTGDFLDGSHEVTGLHADESE